MAYQDKPDPWQADYERQKAAGFPAQAPATPYPGVRQPGAASPRATAARTTPAIPPRKLIVGGVVLVLIIIGVIVSHVIASSNAISVGDCVVTNPNVLTGWDIKKVACNSNPGPALVVQKVVSVQSGSNGQCDLGLTTFQDDPSNQTYCLNNYSFGGG